MTEARIYHLALPADWDHAAERGRYAVSTRGLSLADEGFIHCSYLHQIEPVANRLPEAIEVADPRSLVP